MQPAHNPRRSLLPLAKNALRKLRTVRHPDVLRLLDSAETPTAVYIAVERVRPLGKALEENNAGRSGTQREEWIGWGLSRVTVSTSTRRAVRDFAPFSGTRLAAHSLSDGRR